MPRVTLIGYRGCGKSTVAAELARRLGCGWEDADTVLEARVGSSIADIISGRGEPSFRDLESELLAGPLSACEGVLATGGGVVLRPENRALLRRNFRPVVWLTAPASVVRARLAADPATAVRRPALSGGDPLDEVSAAIDARHPLYRECADHVVDASQTAAAAVAGAIAAWLEREWQP